MAMHAQPGRTMTRAMAAAEEAVGEPLAAYLRRRYYEEDLTLLDIAEEREVEVSTIWRWMRRLGIPRKTLQPPAEERAS